MPWATLACALESAPWRDDPMLLLLLLLLLMLPAAAAAAAVAVAPAAPAPAPAPSPAPAAPPLLMPCSFTNRGDRTLQL